MKSKKEIEQLGEQYLQKNKHNFDTWKEIEHSKITYVNAYNQCQEDIRKDWQSYTISEKADFIEFLNNQD